MSETLGRINEIQARLAPLASPSIGPSPAKSADTQRFSTVFDEAASKTGVDPNLLKAVAQTESAGDPNAVSRSGAMGLMQLMPDTAHSLGVNAPLDPRENVIGGAKYLRGLLDHYKDLPTTLAAYNAGPGAVDRHGGIPPYRETQAYVKKVIALYQGTGE